MNSDACPLCHKPLTPRWDNVIDAASGESFAVQVCDGCDLGVTSPIPAELGAYYSQHYHGGRHGFTARFCDLRRLSIARAVCRRLHRPRLLDFGCGDGTFLQLAKSLGWEAFGYEKYPGPPRPQEVKICTTLDELRDDAKFDCVTMWHVLEHVEDLHATLTTIRNLLSDDGFLVVAVPDNRSWPAAFFGGEWLHLDVPRHLYHFSSKSLEITLKQCGFSSRRCGRSEIEYDVMGWSQSGLNRLGFERNGFMNWLTGRRIQSCGIKKGAMLMLGMLFCAVCSPLAVVNGWMGKGGTLIVVARKASMIGGEAENV